MEPKVLAKNNVIALLKRLMGDAEVIGPKKTETGDVVFEPLEGPEQALDSSEYVQSLFPLKDYFFPQTEPLFTFRKGKGLAPEPIYPEGKKVFFGIRSCDVSGIKFGDSFFLTHDFEDVYYRKRREDSLLISISCLEPGPNCFCVCCDGGPSLKGGYDIQLTPLGKEYFAEVGSAKGESLIEAHKDLFTRATDEGERRKNEALAGVDQKFERSTYVAYAIRKITRGEVPDEWWEGLAEKCFSVSGCRYVCPTCTCFNVVDVMDGNGGVRQRSWDSCSFVGFTRMVSGETPREKPGDLLRRWGEHKLNFFYVLRDGRHGCVGCGRCLTTSLGKGDTWNIVNRIRELSQEE